MTHKDTSYKVCLSLMIKKGDVDRVYPSLMIKRWRLQELHVTNEKMLVTHLYQHVTNVKLKKIRKIGYKIYLVYITNTHVLSIIYIKSKQISSIRRSCLCFKVKSWFCLYFLNFVNLPLFFENEGRVCPYSMEGS